MTFDFLVIIVIVNLMITITLWRTAARKPAKLKNKFVTELLRGKPIEPTHQPPKDVGAMARDQDWQFFNDFKDFADVVNWWFSDAHVGTNWRLQELADTDLKHDFSDMARYGRRYDVFHNHVRVGTLEVSPGLHYSAERPNIRTSIQLEWVRLLSAHTIRSFLSGMALHVCDPDPLATERIQASAAIEASLTTALWETQKIWEVDLDDYGSLELELNGLAVWYFKRGQAPAFRHGHGQR
jgi:hypothetical protein